MASFRKTAKRYYRGLLGLYPGDFRAEYGGEMEFVFEERSRQERLLPLLWETTVDAFRTAPKEHFAMLLQDIRYAFRAMKRNPAFTLVAVLSLALGIGANSAMFSLADALLLRPLAIPRASEVVTIRSQMQGQFTDGISWLDYRDIREKSRSFAGLVAYELVPFGFSARPDELARMKGGMMVSGNFFDVLGVSMAAGRGFTEEEDRVPGRDAVAVLSHETWKTYFNQDPGAIGRPVRLNGLEFTVVGVASESFKGVDQYFRPAFYVPTAMSPRLAGRPEHNILVKRGHRSLELKGRLKPGVSLQQVNAELNTIADSLAAAYPDTNRDRKLMAREELQMRIEKSPPDAALVGMLMTLVGLVLLIACANVANLLLSRGQSRAREIAVRLAVGAGRGRLVRQLLTESLILALCGAITGLGFAYLGVRFFSQIDVPTEMPLVIKPELDARMLLFTLGAALVSAFVFGLAPAISSARADVAGVIKSSPTSGGRRIIGRNLLVVTQLALSLVLLVCAGALLQGFRSHITGDPGYRRDRLLIMTFDPSLVRYSTEKAKEFFQKVYDRTRELPGVQSAAWTQVIPMGNQQYGVELVPEGYQLPNGMPHINILGNTVSPSYFDTFGIKLVQGRPFLETDKEGSPPVAIVNEVMAQRIWPGQNPLGKRLRLEGGQGPWAEVVGVARTTKYLWVGEPPTSFLYLPLAQNPRSRLTLMVHSQGDPAALLPSVRDVVRSIDPDQPVFEVMTFGEYYERRMTSTLRLLMQVVLALGLMGGALALVGLYAVVAYSVSRRTREIGIRMAIGAGRGQVLRMVLKQGAVLGGLGIGIGLLISLATSRLMAAAFVGIADTSIAVFLIVPVALFAVTVLAAWIPARRASRVDPMNALRYE